LNGNGSSIINHKVVTVVQKQPQHSKLSNSVGRAIATEATRRNLAEMSSTKQHSINLPIYTS